MFRLLAVFFFVFSVLIIQAQTEKPFPEIEEMRWGNEFTVEMSFSNDSSYVYDVEELHHSTSYTKNNRNELVYYPVGFEHSFIERLKNRKISNVDTLSDESLASNKTLWSAIHYSIGGSYVHFINCLLYALEIGELKISVPLLERPESNWRPKPMTESFKRTRKWRYYIPETQKAAIKEYKLKEKQGDLLDLQTVPGEFIDLFLGTNDKEYVKLREARDFETLSKIDLIRLLISTNYLGEVQIRYIKNRVLKAMSRYSVNQLPSVIILDDFNAAVAMSLDEKGYTIQKIVFRNQQYLSDVEMDERRKTIKALIVEINELNKEVFQKSLQMHYRK